MKASKGVVCVSNWGGICVEDAFFVLGCIFSDLPMDCVV